MDACRRVVAALLFLLWAGIGVPLPGTGPEPADYATRGTNVSVATGRRRDPETLRAQQVAPRSAIGDDDDDGQPAWLCGPAAAFGAPPAAVRRARALSLPSTRSPLAGAPRGPPSLT